VTESVALLDVLPTFFDWVGLEPLPEATGRSLLPILDGKASGHPVRAETSVTGRMTGEGVHTWLASVRTTKWKYVVEWSAMKDAGVERLFDLEADPGETADLMERYLAGEVALPEDFRLDVERTQARMRDVGMPPLPPHRHTSAR
jgi:arylsulfatase A-like enzyme